MNNRSVLGVIPARGGSKGIPRKNIKELLGKPLISYTIEEANRSHLLTHVLVSTDDEEIQKISIMYGAEAPFLRPPELAQDTALAIPTIQHAVIAMEKLKGILYDYIVMLQPTAPLRKSWDIDRAMEVLIDSHADGIISIVDVDNWHPVKMKKFFNGWLVDYESWPVENPPRQTLPTVFMVNGAIYAAKRAVLMEKGTFKGDRCLGYVMPPERSVNIDSAIDFVIAEFYLTHSPRGEK